MQGLRTRGGVVRMQTCPTSSGTQSNNFCDLGTANDITTSGRPLVTVFVYYLIYALTIHHHPQAF